MFTYNWLSKIKCDCYLWCFPQNMWSESMFFLWAIELLFCPICKYDVGRIVKSFVFLTSQRICTATLWQPLVIIASDDRSKAFRRMRDDEPTHIGGVGGGYLRCRDSRRERWDAAAGLYKSLSQHREKRRLCGNKLKVSQRFTVFVWRRLRHSVSGPAPTRYTLHGRLLQTTTSTPIHCWNVCSSWRGGRKRGGWGVAEKKSTRKRKSGLVVLVQTGREGWDLAQQGPVLTAF